MNKFYTVIFKNLDNKYWGFIVSEYGRTVVSWEGPKVDSAERVEEILFPFFCEQLRFTNPIDYERFTLYSQTLLPGDYKTLGVTKPDVGDWDYSCIESGLHHLRKMKVIVRIVTNSSYIHKENV